MSMTSASADYFQKVAGEWDTIRSGYFTEAVREAAIRKAYLRPEMNVADIGAGTGFMSAGLAPLVKQVYVIDGSPAMLDIARQNLKDFPNLVFQEAEGGSLPLPDASLDVVFANMYLHHIPEPLAAIQEIVRVLRPGGRVVITDMDAHPYEWLKAELADVWAGFERPQLRAWYEQAGLVNIIVDCTGQSCCAEAQNTAITDAEGRVAQISIFVAAGTKPVSGARQAVQANYAAAAQRGSVPLAETSCCSPAAPTSEVGARAGACCGGGSEELIKLDDPTAFIAPFYTPLERQSVPAEAAELSLGCGNPLAMAGLQPGEVVVDIGSGAGMDAFLAARQVGAQGRVIGVDMTPAMLERARRGAQKAGLLQVEFRQGQAEALPVGDATVDVVISNCVINLTEDKGRVFREAYRVLKPGGRLEVSDIVTDRPFPATLSSEVNNWPGCVYGALPEQEYLDLVAQAGFTGVRTRRSASVDPAADVQVYSLAVSAKK